MNTPETFSTGLIDTHFHIDHVKGNPRKELQNISEGLACGIDIGLDVADHEQRKSLISKFSNIYMSQGLSPAYAQKENLSSALDALDKQLDHEKVIACGEIGLDYHWNYGTPERQKELFNAQIDLANNHGLPIIIHNRKADQDMLQILTENPVEKGGIFHCFSSDKHTAEKAIDLGFFISFAGNVTFKNAKNIQEAAEILPEQNIFCETDSPFLTPVPHRGKPNNPLYVAYVYKFISELKEIPLETLILQVGKNVKTLFPSLSAYI
ncbi:MAG: TatD family hydrolase [Spirochaetia bacterium]